MTVLSKPSAAAPSSKSVRPVRDIWVKGTFLSRLWATLIETVMHPFTDSVLRYSRPTRPGEANSRS
jgi:hypothetical protein